MMGTHNVPLSQEERELMLIWMDNAWKMADDVRMGTTPGSKKEAEALAYQQRIEAIQAKLSF
jgi:hypothetical protein